MAPENPIPERLGSIARAGAGPTSSLRSNREAPIIEQNAAKRQEVRDLSGGVENAEAAFGNGFLSRSALGGVFPKMKFLHFRRKQARSSE